MSDKIIIKTGTRALKDDEVKMILGNYDDIFTKIDEMRKNAYGDNGENENIDVLNNISILGKRGAGKTSILKSIINKLKEKDKGSKENIVLPMILSESIQKNMDFMAVILGMFGKMLEENKGGMCSKCRKKINREIDAKYKELVKMFTYNQEEFNAISVNEYISHSDYSEKMAEKYTTAISFKAKFDEFIDEYLDSIKECECKAKNPLIFIIIDDIDLSTYNCFNIIKTLNIYLSNSKIVTIVSGDLDTFKDEIIVNLLKESDLLDKGLMSERLNVQDSTDKNILDKKNGLADEYLKKILPPIYRYRINEFIPEERAKFYIENQNGDNPNKIYHLYELLERIYKNTNVKFTYRYDKYGNEISEPMILKEIFFIFDSTSRGLSNVYKLLVDMYNKIIDNREIELDEKLKLMEVILYTSEIGRRNAGFIEENINIVRSGDKNKIRINSRIFNLDTKSVQENLSLTGDRSKKREDKLFIFLYTDLYTQLIGSDNLVRNSNFLGMYKRYKDYVTDIIFNGIKLEHIVYFREIRIKRLIEDFNIYSIITINELIVDGDSEYFENVSTKEKIREIGDKIISYINQRAELEKTLEHIKQQIKELHKELQIIAKELDRLANEKEEIKKHILNTPIKDDITNYEDKLLKNIQDTNDAHKKYESQKNKLDNLKYDRAIFEDKLKKIIDSITYNKEDQVKYSNQISEVYNNFKFMDKLIILCNLLLNKMNESKDKNSNDYVLLKGYTSSFKRVIRNHYPQYKLNKLIQIVYEINNSDIEVFNLYNREKKHRLYEKLEKILEKLENLTAVEINANTENNHDRKVGFSNNIFNCLDNDLNCDDIDSWIKSFYGEGFVDESEIIKIYEI